jgi:hypothetical protein
MDLISRISENFSESAHLKLQSMDVLAAPIASAAEKMVQCLKHDGKILACGNGGSAADSQHFSSELLNRFEMERPGLAAIALTTDTSTLTSIANDFDYEQIFSRQVRALGNARDLLLATSWRRSKRPTRAECAWSPSPDAMGAGWPNCWAPTTYTYACRPRAPRASRKYTCLPCIACAMPSIVC